MKAKVGFQRGTQCHMCGEVRQLREETCVSGLGVLFEGVGRDWGPKQAAQDEVEKRTLNSSRVLPPREAFRDAFVFDKALVGGFSGSEFRQHTGLGFVLMTEGNWQFRMGLHLLINQQTSVGQLGVRCCSQL